MVSGGGHRRYGGASQGGAGGGGRSSESSSERGAPPCPHVLKSVDLNKLRKALLKASNDGGSGNVCSQCPPEEEAAPPGGAQEYEEDQSLWVCLMCGSRLCGRMRNKHALKHFETPRSDLHALAAHVSGTQVYCYVCNGEVELNAHKRLKEAVDMVRRGSSKRSTPESDPEPNFTMKLTAVASTFPTCDIGSNVRGVRGLSNLGNTCFFNSVMQCLVQTPYLVDVLREMAVPGQKFRLPGGVLKLKTTEKKDGEEEEEEETEINLPPICGELNKWGDLTETLANTLQELQTPGRFDVFSPSKLFSKFETKVPQFAGGDQHDSHELLRHLLEAVRNEDLARYRVVILQKLGLDSKEKRNDVDEETKQKVKFYGQQASDTMLRPGQVFRGLLVSTLQCQDCQYSSHTSEHFLDLSLPVTADKPQPPAIARRKTQEEQINCLGAPENEKSKHQLKKEKQAMRKFRRSRKEERQLHIIKSDDQNGDANENKIENKSSSEQSDADVEDNADENSKQESSSNSQQRDTASQFGAYYYMESGYNSEKVISSDSIRASPVDLENKEKTDISPERTDKDLNECIRNLPSTIALPYKTLGGDDSPQVSNPDSGVASPETAKHAMSETVNVESPLTSKELGSPTSLSSEINMDISSPRQSNNSPVGAELDRPVSRISFNEISVQKLADLQKDTTNTNAENDTKAPDKIKDLYSDLNNLYLNKNQDSATTTRQAGASFNPSLGLNFNTNENNQDNNASERGPSGVPMLTSPDIDSSSWKKDIMSNHVINTVSPRYQCDDGEISIQSCLNQFTSSELLTGSNKVGCEACTKRSNTEKQVYTNATKRFLISNPPAVLILHLKRFQLGPRCILRKVTKSVNFPTILDIAPFCSEEVKTLPNVAPNQSKILYSLYGVVEHSGGMHLGHYVAYVKVRPEVKPGDARWKFLPTNISNDGEEDGKSPDLVNGLNNSNDNDTDSSLSGYESGEGAVGGSEVEPPSGKWYYISDTRVQETTEEKVLKVQAYLLFYERIL